MLHFLVSVVNTLVTVSLLVALLLGYAAQRDFLEVRSPVKYGSLVGLCFALTLALLEFTSALVVREFYNLVVLCLILLLELALLCKLACSRNLPPEKAAGQVMRLLFFAIMAAWAAFYLPDIFIYPSHFAVGVVQLASSEFVFIVCGYLLGLLLCLLLGYSFFRVCRAIPVRPLFALLLPAMCAFALIQFVNVIQILLGRGLVPRSDWALDLVIFLLNRASWLLYLIFALAAGAAFILWRKSKQTRPEGENPAIRRKVQSLMHSNISWSKTSLSALVAGLLLVTLGSYYANKKVELDPPTQVEARDGIIYHPTSLVGDGKLHRFVYKTKQGVDVRYIIIKKSETAYGVGLDACDVCGPSGYYERKGQVICILCDVVMNKATIGFAGGCNPVPLKFRLGEGSVLVETAALEAEAHRFL